MEGKFNLKYFLVGTGKESWFKALGNGWRIGVIIILIIVFLSGGLSLWRFFFPKPSSNINKPIAVALPFSKVEKIDQTSTQIMVTEKDWYAEVFGAGINYDNKSGIVVGGRVGRKW